MPDIKSTRLRHISAKSLDEVEAAVGLLSFKVEHKQTLWADERWYVFFTLPDNSDFTSVDMDGQ